MHILLKFPTRGRPNQFLVTLKGWLDQASDPKKISVLVSYDVDDTTMAPDIIAKAEAMCPGLIACEGVSASKIAACNRDLPEYWGKWDVVLLASDDMWCRRQAWDEIIRKKMTEFYPDTDGVLWFHDGSKQREIMTLSCIGRSYYQRDGFIYNPAYLSFFCDNEQTDLARQRGKITFIEQPIATHEHPAWGGGMKRDATYVRNNPYWAQDQATYARRKAEGFPSDLRDSDFKNDDHFG